MAVSVYLLFSLCHVGLLIWALMLYPRAHSRALLILLAISATLIYDNFVVAFGSFMGQGAFLQLLNGGRYLLHALLTPLLILAALDIAQRAGVKWAQKRNAFLALGALTVVLIAVGLFNFVNMELVAEEFQGTLRYKQAASTPPIPAIVSILVVLGIGFFVWRASKIPWMFLGALVMFIAAAIPSRIAGPWLASGGEIILLAGFLLTEQLLLKRGAAQVKLETA